MADMGGLQLLPETRKRIDIVAPGENKTLTMGVVILVITIISILAFYFYKNSLENRLADLDSEIVALEQQRNKQTEQSIITLNKQISLLSNLLTNHVAWSLVFSKIESLLQSQIRFESVTTSLAENKVDIKAVAANYTTIARQIAAFVSDKSIENVDLNKVSTRTNGQLEFNMRLIFNKDALKLK